jgi:DNA-binding NarL/FixJ family response regulator
MIKLLLADDDPNVLLGLRMRLALEPDLTVLGEAANGAEALELAAALQPDVVVLDVQMPVVDGIAAARVLSARDPRMALVVLSIHDDGPTRARSELAGVRRFIGKHESVDSLVAAIREVADHGSCATAPA